MTYCVSGSRSNQLSYNSILWTERDSNPRRLDLQSNALPTELPVHFLWEQKDSNLPSMQITEFTVRRLTNSSITPILSFLLDSNQRHLPCKGSALPTELRKVSKAIAFLNRIRANIKTIQGYYLRIKDSLVLPL